MDGAEIFSPVKLFPADPKWQAQKASFKILVRKLALDQLNEIPVRLGLDLYITPPAAADLHPVLSARLLTVVGLFFRIH